jgi:hypothetical protein
MPQTTTIMKPSKNCQIKNNLRTSRHENINDHVYSGSTVSGPTSDQSIPWEGTWKLQEISYFTDLRQTGRAKNIPKTVSKTQNQRNHVHITFVKYRVVSPKPLKEAIFSVSGIFIEKYLKSLTCCEKSKNRFGLNAPTLSKNCWFFFNTQKFVHYFLVSVFSRQL